MDTKARAELAGPTTVVTAGRHWFPDGAFWHTSEYLMGNKHCQALSSSPGSRRIHSCGEGYVRPLSVIASL
ncbi:hypothetical protein ABBQ38_011422 [Trebouxia sp. C0009 RCD-2024]